MCRVTNTSATRGSLQLGAPEVLEQGTRRVVSRRAGHGAARMRTRPREIEPVDAAEAPRARPLAEHLPVEDVAAGDAETVLELLRPQHHPVDDVVGQPGTDLREAGDRDVSCGV